MSTRQRILIVEDDEPIRLGLADALAGAGYAALEAPDGPAGLAAALADEPDLVLLDLMLPGLGGLEVLSELRASRPAMPVIILTALGDEEKRVAGLQAGADDYVVKPFSVRELLARVESVLRRSPGRPSGDGESRFPGGRIDAERSMLVFDDGRTCPLGQREAELLRYLLANPGRTVGREEILLHVWAMRPEGIETRTVDMHVARLREKLFPRHSPREREADWLRTVRGKGYLYDPGEARP